MIELRNVEKTYHTASGDIHALKRTSLTIEQGEIFGIIGLSGAGKSTLIRCINMLEQPTAGQIFVDGEELTAMTETQLRKARQNIGMIFQHFNLLASRTVYDNIAFPLEIQGLSKDEIRKRVEPLLDLVQLRERADHYPSQLSGGQKQRVGIARALASNPKRTRWKLLRKSATAWPLLKKAALLRKATWLKCSPIRRAPQRRTL